MLRLLLAFVVATCGALSASAQNVGDTAQAVEAAFGRPQVSRTTNKGDVWIYSSGLRVTLKNGVVTAIEGLEAGAPVPTVAPVNTTVVTEAEPVRSASHSVDTPAAPSGKFKMSSLAMFLVIVLGLVAGIGQLIILARAFKQSVLWGFGCLFIPGVALIFIVCHWSEVKGPVLTNLGATAVMVALAVGFGLFEHM